MRKVKKVVYPKKIEGKPSKYDQELLKQIAEIKEFPRVESLWKDNDLIKSVKSDSSTSKELIKAGGLLYDFQNPIKTENAVKKVVTDKHNYSDEDLIKAFGVTDDKIVSEFSSVYKSQQLWKFHEAIRISGAYCNAQEKTFDFVTGIDYTHLETDVNDSFPDKDMKNIALEIINNNFVIFSLKNELEEIDRSVDLRKKILSLMINKRTFGRAAQKIVTNENTMLPEAIEILFPMLLGRVFYTQRTKQIVGIEYDDTDEDTPPEDKLIPSTKLIYAINRDYGQSPGSLFYGYSDAEFFQHLIETNFIIDAYDLKELNKNQYISKKIIQVLDSDSNVVTDMTAAVKESDLVVTKYGVKVDALSNEHSGNFLVDERSSNEDKITEDLQMPNILMGRKTSDTFAIATQVMQSFNQTTANKFRMEIREIYEPSYYNRNLKQIIKNRLEFLNSIKGKYNGDRTSDTILKELLVYNKDDLGEDEIKAKELLKQEYKLQRDREKWERYRAEFIDKRLKIIKAIINENDSIDPEEADQIFQQIKAQVEKNYSFDLEDLQLPDPKPRPPPLATKFGFVSQRRPGVTGMIPPKDSNPEMDKDAIKQIPKPSNGEAKPKPFVKAAGLEPLPEKEPLPEDKPTEEDKPIDDKDIPDLEIPDYSEDWKDTSLPSPSTIEFEIQELEKLSVLEPVEYPFKYKMTFKNVSLMTDLEKSASILAQKKEEVLDVEDARQELGYEDIVNREQLKTRLSEQIMDLIKKYVKPRPEDEMQQFQQFGNKAREMIDTAEEVKNLMNSGNPNPVETPNKQSSSPLSLNKAVSNQGTKKPLVRVDQTSTP
jgi:hypothetical protein